MSLQYNVRPKCDKCGASVLPIASFFNEQFHLCHSCVEETMELLDQALDVQALNLDDIRNFGT